MKTRRQRLFGLALMMLATTANADVTITSDYPGANIVIVQQDGNEITMRQDHSKSARWWFYWNFEANGTPGETVRFVFTDRDVIGTRGPAISLDQGLSWTWLGTDVVSKHEGGVAFRYTFPEDVSKVRIAFAPPYQVRDLNRFLDHHTDNPHLVADTLCTSEEGRPVPRLRISTPGAEAKHRVLLTARHHACESMASYVLEGILSTLLGNTDDGQWFRDNVEVLAIPLVDVDGVENGDQGKNRTPRDHGRDYKGESLYNSTRAIRETVPPWADGRLHFTLDIHCPHIRGGGNEHIYLVGHERPEIWAEQQRFARALEAIPNAPLPYKASNDMPFGQSWNTAKNYTAGAGVFQWAGTLPGTRNVGAIEIPYANAGDVTVTTENARAFGATLVTAMRNYLENIDE